MPPPRGSPYVGRDTPPHTLPPRRLRGLALDAISVSICSLPLRNPIRHCICLHDNRQVKLKLSYKQSNYYELVLVGAQLVNENMLSNYNR